jgi:hypothetical protein
LVSKYFSSEKLCDWQYAIEPVSKLEDTDKASELKEFSPEATLAVLSNGNNAI